MTPHLFHWKRMLPRGCRQPGLLGANGKTGSEPRAFHLENDLRELLLVPEGRPGERFALAIPRRTGSKGGCESRRKCSSRTSVWDSDVSSPLVACFNRDKKSVWQACWRRDARMKASFGLHTSGLLKLYCQLCLHAHKNTPL